MSAIIFPQSEYSTIYKKRGSKESAVVLAKWWWMLVIIVLSNIWFIHNDFSCMEQALWVCIKSLQIKTQQQKHIINTYYILDFSSKSSSPLVNAITFGLAKVTLSITSKVAS